MRALEASFGVFPTASPGLSGTREERGRESSSTGAACNLNHVCACLLTFLALGLLTHKTALELAGTLELGLQVLSKHLFLTGRGEEKLKNKTVYFSSS